MTLVKELKSIAPGRLPRRLVLSAAAGLCIGRLALAQAPVKKYRLAFVVQSKRHVFGALFEELQRQGLIEGKNLVTDPNGFGLSPDELEAAARDAVRTTPDAIYSGGVAANQAVKHATTTIPVIVIADDILAAHIVTSLARPDGNITGISIFATELDIKRLGLLVDLVPHIAHVAVLFDPATTPDNHLQTLATTGRARAVDLVSVPISSPREIEKAIDSAWASGAEAFDVLTSALFHAHRERIIEGIRETKLPAIYQWPEYCAEGALIGYGPSITALYRQAADMLVKVMKGAKPADMPVQQPSKFELSINLNTANELGLVVPPSILAAVDNLIE